MILTQNKQTQQINGPKPVVTLTRIMLVKMRMLSKMTYGKFICLYYSEKCLVEGICNV